MYNYQNIDQGAQFGKKNFKINSALKCETPNIEMLQKYEYHEINSKNKVLTKK